MKNDFNTLKDFINFLAISSKAHICIHDFSGILSNELLNIDIKNKIHSTSFCDIAKSTPEGYKLCMKCKNLANNAAISRKELFFGHCPNGMLEIAMPVIINGSPVCIIYVGNIISDRGFSLKKIEKTCLFTGVDSDKLKSEAKKAETAYPLSYHIKTAELISSYIKLVSKIIKIQTNNADSNNYIIKSITEYIFFNYDKNLTLKTMSRLYFMNEKYLGRLFAKETGYSFHNYLNNIRLAHAAELLKTTKKTIIDISVDCGFTDVTYFNRVFKKTYALTPTEYRKH